MKTFYFLDTTLNASVLTQPNGTFCICYQHQPQSNPTEQRQDSQVVFLIHFVLFKLCFIFEGKFTYEVIKLTNNDFFLSIITVI